MFNKRVMFFQMNRQLSSRVLLMFILLLFYCISNGICSQNDANQVNFFESNKSKKQDILSYCGDPGRPPKSQINPVQTIYIDGETVSYTCDEFISLKQYRKCVKGRWIGSTPVCGAAFRDNDIISARFINLESGNITNEYELKDALQDFQKFGNSFIAERYSLPVRGEGARKYKVELTLEKLTQIHMIRISFSVVDHLINKDLEKAKFNISSISAASGQKCEKISENSVSPWHFNSTRFDFWYFCLANDPLRNFKSSLDLSNKIIIETYSDIPIKIDLATFILAEVYNNNNNRSDPICGLPEIPLGLEARVVNDQSRYSFNCAKNFQRTSTSGGQFHLRICGHDLHWHGELPVCSPLKTCPYLETDRNLLVEIFKYDKIFYNTDEQWHPIAGSRAYFRCKDDTHIFVGKEIRTCTEDGEWTNSIPNCLASVVSDSLRTTTILIIIFVTLIVTFILSSATIYFFLKLRPAKDSNGIGFPGLEMADSAYYADTCDPLKSAREGEVYETLEPMEARYTSGYGHENHVLLKTSQFPDEIDSYERIGDFTSGFVQHKPEVRFLGTEQNNYYDDGISNSQPEMAYQSGSDFINDKQVYQPMCRF